MKTLKALSAVFLAVLSTAALLQTATAGSATWNLSPTDGNWYHVNNWTPATIPNGATDIATFDLSNTTAVSLAANTTVLGLAFNSGASAYTIAAAPGFTLTVGDNGVVNNSGIGQNFEAATKANSSGGTISFTGNASAGALNVFTVDSVPAVGSGSGSMNFYNDSSAGSSTFINKADNGVGGPITFHDTSSAADGTFINEPASPGVPSAGQINFFDSSTAGNGIFVAHSGMVAIYGSADHGTFTFEGGNLTNNGVVGSLQAGGTLANASFIFGGGSVADALGAYALIVGRGTCEQATITLNGGSAPGAYGGSLELRAYYPYRPSAGSATFIIKGGSNGGLGGTLVCSGSFTEIAPDGDRAQLEIFGNGTLDLRQLEKPFHTGSIEGNGTIRLGGTKLSVGTRNTNTTFSGLIKDGGGFLRTSGSLTKVGTGTLTLTRANTYRGTTNVTGGTLLVNNKQGSATGTGAVSVNGATLGGRGIIAGSVTVGNSGASSFLAPAGGGTLQASLTIQGSLTLQPAATYTYTFKARETQISADQIIANGVTVNSATIDLQGTILATLETGTVVTVISNTSANPISGTFNNLPDGGIIAISGTNFQANYEGGDGNDLTLTVVP